MDNDPWEQRLSATLLHVIDESDLGDYARASVRSLLRCLEHKGRDPDHWEIIYTVRAIGLLKAGEHGEAIDAVSIALLPPARRDPALLAETEAVFSAANTSPCTATLKQLFAIMDDGLELPSIH
jgi:hypothetical protein